MPYYPDEVTEVRLPAGVRANRAKRRRRRHQRQFATVAVLALALVVGVNARSWAHSVDLEARSVCVEGQVIPEGTVHSQQGDYRFAGTASDSEGHSAPVVIGAGGGQASVRLGPVSGPGVLRVVGDFYKESGAKAEHMDRQAGYRFLDDCKRPEPTTTTGPTPTTIDQPTPTTAPEVGTPTNQHRSVGPPDQHGPPVTAPPVEQPGTLPFTGPRDWLLPIGLGLFVAGAAMVLAGRRRFQQMTLAAKAVDRAMHKPYKGPHEPV